MEFLHWTGGDLYPEKGRAEKDEYYGLFRFDEMDADVLDKVVMEELIAQHVPNPYLTPRVIASIQITEKDFDVFKEKVVELFSKLLSINTKTHEKSN